jgi:FAD/FMN-containing dehydrogenase
MAQLVPCTSAADVAAALERGRRAGIHVVPRGGGHCFAGRSSTDGIVLDMRPMRSVSLAPSGTVNVGAGAPLGEVYAALHGRGLTLPLGCGPTVGIAGLTLGGGLGLLGRRYGLTCDRLIGATAVLADGSIVDCSAEREPDLFWALRGAGGGQFGVVTSLRFEPVPEPVVTGFEYTWPSGDAAEVVAAWQRWAPDAPAELTANLTISPAGVRMFGAGSLVDEFPGPPPATRTSTPVPFSELKQSLGEPVYRKSEFFRQPLPEHVITELLTDVKGKLNFTAMGGAYNRVPADATAFAHRSERFLLEHVSLTDPQWPQRSWEIAHPHASGGVYPNFPDPDLTDWAHAYHGTNYDRLARIKKAYDPDRLFHFPQSL